MSTSRYRFTLTILMIFFLNACQDFVNVNNRNEFTVTGISIQNGKVHFTGTGLTHVVSVAGNSSNLSAFSISILSKSHTTLITELKHSSLNSLEITRGSVSSFSLSNGKDQTIVNLNVEAAYPTGAIIAFNGACPSGWSEFTSSRGRVFVGEGNGNTDALGAALTSRSLGTVGGLEYTTGIPVNDSTSATTDIAAPGVTIGVTSISFFSDGIPALDTFWGSKANSNLPPYVVIRHCEKL